MSNDHRRPVVAFVLLILAAVAVVSVQRADAQGGRLLAAPAGVSVRAQGTIPAASATVGARELERLAQLGPAFVFLRESVHVGVTRVGEQAGADDPVLASETGTAPTRVDVPGRTTAAGTRAVTPAKGPRRTSGVGPESAREGLRSTTVRKQTDAVRAGRDSHRSASPPTPHVRPAPHRTGPHRHASHRHASRRTTSHQAAPRAVARVAPTQRHVAQRDTTRRSPVRAARPFRR